MAALTVEARPQVRTLIPQKADSPEAVGPAAPAIPSPDQLHVVNGRVESNGHSNGQVHTRVIAGELVNVLSNGHLFGWTDSVIEGGKIRKTGKIFEMPESNMWVKRPHHATVARTPKPVLV